MESLAHSISKKGYGGTGFGSASHKSVYDDVFGGSPKFGVPTSLAPRFEDYGEIFGGFHTSRGLSIPVLDLPSVDEGELSFDVRSSWFDYSEVFGGFHDLDFAVSFDDLVRKFDSGGDYSSDDAWSPDQIGSFSDELDPSVCSSNADSSYIAAGVTKFHTSYYKANQRTSGEIAFDVTKETHLSGHSGHGSYVDKSHASQKRVEPCSPATGDCDSKIDCVGKYVERKQFRSSMPATIASGSHATELFNLEKSNRSHAQSMPFVTINDISLRTKPSGIPPPSRPPPLFAVKMGASENADLKDSTSKYAFEQGEGSHSPLFYDVEVDVSSSKSASTTIRSSLETDVNNTMEVAESRRNCVKQSIEKKEIPYCHIKALDEDKKHPPSEERNEDTRVTEELPSVFDGEKCGIIMEKPSESRDNAKLAGPRIRETNCRANSSMDDMTQGTHATEGNEKHLPSEERNEETRVTEELTPVFDGEKCGNIMEKPSESRDVGEYKLSPHLPHRFEGTFAWRQETEYFEVVETDLPSEAVVNDNYGYTFVPDRSDKYRQGKRAGTEAFEAEREAHDSNGEKNQEDWLEENHISADHTRQPGATMESSCVKDSQKKSIIDTDCYEEEIGGRKMKTGKQIGDMVNLQNESHEIVENVVKAHMKNVENEERLNEWGTGERINTDEIVMDIHEKKANGRRHWKSFETVDNHKISNNDVEQIVKEKLEVRQEKRNKNKKQHHDKGENKKNPDKFCDGIDDGNITEEATENDYIVDELKEANSYQEIEDKLKRTDEEENARDGKVYSQIEAKIRHSKVVLDLVKNEKHIEMTPVELYEEKLKDACDTCVVDDVNHSAVMREGWDESTLRFAFDKYYNEGSSRVTNAPPESMARNEDASGHKAVGGLVEHIKWDDDSGKTHVLMKRSNLEVSDSLQEEMHITLIPQESDTGFINLESTTESISHTEDENLETVSQTSDQKLEEKTTDFVGEEVSGKTQKNLPLEKLEASTEDIIEAFCLNEPVTDLNQSGIDIGTSSTGHDIKASPMTHGPGNVKFDNNEGQGEKLVRGVQFTVGQEISRNEPRSYQTSTQQTEDNKKTEVASSRMVGEKASELSAGQRFVRKNAEREERLANECLASEERKAELRLQKEREYEKEQLRKLEERERERAASEERKAELRLQKEREYEKQLRKLEEEREREREREKDRMAVDSTTFGNRGRSFADNLARAERPAVERATAEVRQRVASTHERLEKDSMEARDRYLAERASTEARLRAERGAVEKATAEARQRAFAKTMSEKSVPERVERSVSDKFSSSSRMAEARQNSFPEQQKVPPQGAGTSSMLRYSYSSVNSGVESESPQRYKSRLERYRRTAERAANALAEKNMRDLLVQKELAERCRLAESLDVEIKRWSSGKEGNLRALLSTLQYILGSESGWQPIPLTEVITTAAVKKAYRKATLCVHPDKLQQRGASIQQKYICEKIFDLLKEAWSTFNSEER